MDDHNKKNPFDDFFPSNKREENDENYKASQDEQRPKDSNETGEGGSNEASKSYYYSYRPFKPTDQNSELNVQPGTDEPGGQVEVTPPQQMRSFAPTQPARNGWQVKEPRRTSFRAMFASFLFGVIAVGSLMFAADRGNWFSSHQACLSRVSNTAFSAVVKGRG